MSRRGNVAIEVIVIVAFLFAFSVAAVFTYDFFTNILNDLTDDPDISATATAPTQELHSRYPGIFDAAYLIILVGLWIAAIISAFAIDTSPVFIGISLFALIVILGVPPILGNAFEDIFADDTSSGLLDSFPIMEFIMTHILQFSIVIGGSVMISLYAKSRAL